MQHDEGPSFGLSSVCDNTRLSPGEVPLHGIQVPLTLAGLRQALPKDAGGTNHDFTGRTDGSTTFSSVPSFWSPTPRSSTRAHTDAYRPTTGRSPPRCSCRATAERTSQPCSPRWRSGKRVSRAVRRPVRSLPSLAALGRHEREHAARDEDRRQAGELTVRLRRRPVGTARTHRPGCPGRPTVAR